MRVVLAAALAALFAGAAQAAPTLDDYARSPAVEAMTLSPSGEQIATIAVADGARRVIALSLDGKIRLAAPLGALKVERLTWAGEDHLLIANSQVVDQPLVFAASYEMGTRLVVDLKTQKVTGVFGANSGIYPAIMRDYGVARIDGKWVAFYGAITLAKSGQDPVLDHTFADLYQVDLDSGAARLVAKGGDLPHDWVVAADGSIAARSEYDRKTGRWRLLAGGFAGQVLMDRQAPLGRIDVEGLGRTADTVMVRQVSGEGQVIEEQPLSGGAPTRLFAGKPFIDLIHARDGRLLLGAATHEWRDLSLFDPRLQARFDGARKAFPGYQVRLQSLTDDFRRMILFTDGGDDSGTYWLVDIAKGSAKPLGQAYPAITAADVGPTRMVSYTAADGTALDGVLTLPPGAKGGKLPVVVIPNDNAFGDRADIGFDWWAQAFASRGYAVFQPNVRGSGGPESPPIDAGFGEWGRKRQTDISDGLAAIAADGLVDPKRACIVGRDFGGYAALAGVTLQHGIYRCAVSQGGVSDLASFMTDSAVRYGGVTEQARVLRTAIGVKDSGDPLLKQLSPIEHADQADAPILLIHGKQDTLIGVKQSQKMAAALERAGKPYELKLLDGEADSLLGDAARIATLEAAVAFVEKYDPPR